ncbi:MAG TPA: hypothetical protein VL284_20370 [Thermoanaerobaculia bacterium]|nr:hypothetical protein [Thermoanaerobaculia bacterium]
MRMFLAILACAAGAYAQPSHFVLQATPKTVTWGRYDPRTPPVLRMKSGDIVDVHTFITSTPERLGRAGVPADQVEQSLRDIVNEVKDRDDAYTLAGVAGDLSITEVVDGNKGVHMLMPKALWSGGLPAR